MRLVARWVGRATQMPSMASDSTLLAWRTHWASPSGSSMPSNAASSRAPRAGPGSVALTQRST